MSLRPFFPYYGSKWSLAPLYPRPRHDRIIEPFAGSACYSLRHYRRDVVQLEAIRHWTIVEGDGPAQTIHGEATWFIDPPYAGKVGSPYRHGSKGIDYEQLGMWCRHLPGQVIVCEQLGADWLPFERFRRIRCSKGASTEVVWYSDRRDSMKWRQPELFGGDNG